MENFVFRTLVDPWALSNQQLSQATS